MFQIVGSFLIFLFTR